MKRALSFILAMAMVVSFCTCFSLNTAAETYVTEIDGTQYTSIQAAVDAVTAGQTITLLTDFEDGGVKVPSGKEFTLDFAGHTLTVGTPLVGSTGTETNGFQLLKDSTITMKNGTITTTTAKILIQNYSNLTLQDMTLDGSKMVTGAADGPYYTLSNNNGATQLIGNTSVSAGDGNIAFDVCFWLPPYPAVSVTVDTTGTITGPIEYSCYNATPEQVAAGSSLTLKNGTFTGAINVKTEGAKISVSGGKYLVADVTNYLVDGKTVVDGEVVDKPAYEVTIKEQVISATQAIINYLDNTAATDVLENKTITTLLTERLAAYTAAPSADTLNAIVAAWDAWTYGGQDADKVFFTDYFKTLIAAFPTKENGEVYIEAGAAKKSPKDIVQKYMVRVDDTLYVNNYGPSADYDSGAEDSIKVIGRNAMNAATTSSAAYAALQAAIAHLNASCKLISYANLETKLAEAKAVKAGGDETAKADLDYAIGEAEKLMDAHKAVGFWQYRPAGQADSFTEDVAESDAAYKSMISDLTDLINAYNATIVEYEVKIKEQVISATQAIINYLDNTATEVKDGKTITTLLTETLAAYTADPSATTLAALVSAWDSWTYGGHDADRVFFTDYFKTLIAAFPTKENGEVYIEAGAAKKSPKDIVQKYMVRVDDTLYVNNYGPSADYDSGAEDSIKVIGRNAMNAATTSSAAYAALQAAIAHLNASCKLISYANLETKLAEAKAVKAGGDETAKADLDYAIGEAEKLMDAHKAVGFWQYRPAGQADSFIEDVAESDAAYKSMISDLTDLINAYNATIPTGPSGLTFEENGDIRYYEDGVAVVKGLVKDTDGSYYFINSTKKAVKNTWYAFNEAFANGLLPAGRYYFGEDGKLQQLNGVVVEANGDVRYYENGVAVVKGLVKDDAGDYYFINGTKKAVKNTWYAFNATYANGLLPAGRYFFGEDGKLQLKNGVVVESNGDIRYYENNVAVAKGLVEYEGNYYFINSSLKAVKNTYYAFNAKYANGLLPAGRYFFDAEGKLVQQ